MKHFLLFGLLIGQTWSRLCRRRWLLAGLVLLCALLPPAAGRAAETLLSQGVRFGPVTLAVTAPEGDRTPWQLEQFLGHMEDVAQYCTVAAMEEQEALAALESGEVTAVLVLPEHFIRRVMDGENPDLRLIADGDRPLEALLLLWAGQSASDMLAAFQGGVYAVLEQYDASSGLTWDQTVLEINLRYIDLALKRGELFQTQTVSAAFTLPVPLHYTLTLLASFSLSAAPLFLPVYQGSWVRFQRRLRCAGRGTAWGCLSGAAATLPVLLLLLCPALALSGPEANPLALLAAAAGMAAYSSLFCALCCLSSEHAAGCGSLASGTALAGLALAGGIVPPVLLPAGLRALTGLSPVTWLARLAAWPMGFGLPRSALAGLLLTGLGMTGAVLVLYRRRADRREDES